MAYPGFNNTGVFTPNQQREIEQFVSYLMGYLSAQHKDDGSHAAITADSMTATGAVSGSTGTFTGGNVRASDVEIGNIGTSVGTDTLIGPGVRIYDTDKSTIRYEIVNSGVGTLRQLRVQDTARGYVPIEVGWEMTTGYWLGPGKDTAIAQNCYLGSPFYGTNRGVWTAAYTQNGYFERLRGVAVGEWQDVTYNGANFTASAGTWTVDVGDQILFRYMLIGKTMWIAYEFDTTSVSATPSQLRFAIPGGFTAAKDSFMTGYYNNNGAGWVNNGNAFTNAGVAYVGLQPATFGVSTWATSVNNTYVRGQFMLEIQ